MSSRFARAGGATEDAWYDDNAGPIVRLYAMTGEQAGGADREFSVSTMVTSAGGRTAGVDLPPEKSAILRLCARALSVAEIAAYLSLPLGTVEALLGDLRRAGLVQTPAPQRPGHPSAEMMLRLRDGLLAL
jgi:hypothetical protein